MRRRRQVRPPVDPQRPSLRRRPGRRRKPTFAERREFEGLLPEIEALEAEKLELEALFPPAGRDGQALELASRRYAELGPAIHAKTARWEELADMLET